MLRSGAMLAIGLMSASFTGEGVYSPVLLAALDPTGQAASLCGGGAQASMRKQLPLTAALLAAAATTADTPIPLYADLSAPRFRVTTTNAEAQRYFDQGLTMAYGFNHAGAVRSFRAAQRLDPNCAMCWWGEALALGPNINAPMDGRDAVAALAALDRAKSLAASTTPAEQALIAALSQRYAPPPADRAALDMAYADAMLGVAARFPANDDIAVLAAEAVMDTSPWNYWLTDKKTFVGKSGEAVRLVELVLARNPGHVQAEHLYIHLMEAADPARAEAAADLMTHAPDKSAGHLVHMPGHIFQLRGRYADSMRVNIAAARADEAYIASAGDEGLLRYGYYPHNIHFIVMAAQMSGDMPTAIAEAQRLRKTLDPATSARIAWIGAIDAAPYLAMAQFATPEAILALPPPDPRLPYAAAMRLYARAVARAQQRDRAGVEAELAALDALKRSDAFADMIAQGVPVPDLLSLATSVARGRLAYAEGNYEQAAAHYRTAIALEARVPYQEPPYWYYPVSQSLGAALLKAGHPADAADAFRAALAQTPANGWALYGLAEAEAAQGHGPEAAAARAALRRAWAGDPKWLRLERL
jgi:tetratricopeptide (TPR) repeat protein